MKHDELVRKLVKPGKDILAEMTSDKWDILMSTTQEAINVGVVTESVKKHIIYGKELPKNSAPKNPASKKHYSSWTGWQPPENLTARQCHLLHMALGKFGEASELLYCIFKHIETGESLDVKNVVEELGDDEFYTEGLRAELNISRESIIKHNVEKLTERYGGSYSDGAAIARKDKNTG